MFARLVKSKIASFFKETFPGRARIRVLLDSEPLLHTDAAKAALSEFGIEALPDWPKYSPDLNPQENVWSWMESALRKEEQKTDTFAVFSRRLHRVGHQYPNAQNLIGSMANRVKEVLNAKGAMTKY